MSNLMNSNNAVVRYLRETRAEIGKVAWPTRAETQNLSLIVITVTVAMSIMLGFLDFLFASAVQLLLSVIK